MESTDTKEPSLLERAMNLPWWEKAAMKSVRLRQADEATVNADRMAGLAENRRSDRHYKQQTDRAVKATVDKYVNGNGSQPAPDEEEEMIHQDLGDRYEEHHHYPAPAPTASTEKTTTTTATNGASSGVLPWVLAAAMGPLGALGAAWWLTKEQPVTTPPTTQEQVNVKDVQSKFKIEVYDEDGTLLETLPYSELPTKP